MGKRSEQPLLKGRRTNGQQHRKRHSELSVTRGMQIQTQMGCDCYHLTAASSQMLTAEVKRPTSQEKNLNLAVSYKTEYLPAPWLSNVTDIYSREMKTCILKKTCTRILSATSFGQKREITKYPSIGKTDNKHKIHRGKTKKKLTKTPNCRILL